MLDKFPTMVWVKTEAQPVLYSVAHSIPEAERIARPYRITTSWTFPSQPNGFPVAGGLNDIHKLKDRLVSQLAPIGGLFVGHVLSEGRVTVTCYARQMAAATISVKSGLLSKKVFEVTSHRDPEWTFYREELEPSPMQIGWHKYAKLTMTLEQHGDVAKVERPVDFTLEFPSKLAMQAALPELEAAGFKFTDESSLEGSAWWAEVQKVSAVTMEALYPQIELIESIAAKHGGTLDGWACPVTK